MGELAAAAERWGVVNADYAEASDRLAELMLIAAGHSPSSHPTTNDLVTFAQMLRERAADARENALDVGDMAARLRGIAAEDQAN
jgi:hypothetical protein